MTMSSEGRESISSQHSFRAGSVSGYETKWLNMLRISHTRPEAPLEHARRSIGIARDRVTVRQIVSE
jgi:hypothetical protein